MASQPSLNVVPSNFKWSAASAKNAAEKGSFIRVGGNTISRRYLSGAARSWQKDDSEDIYHTGYRITGTPEDVRTALTYAGVSSSDIDKVLKSSITRHNFETSMKETYNQELAKHDDKKGEKPVDNNYSWNDIVFFAKNIKDVSYQSKPGVEKKGVSTGPTETLAEKLAKLTEGKVLDVSQMDPETGKGARTIKKPTTDKSRKFGTERVPIISSDPNLYSRALQFAYGDSASDYDQDVLVVSQAISQAKKGKVAAPVEAAPAAPEKKKVAKKVKEAAPAVPVAQPVTLAAPEKKVPRSPPKAKKPLASPLRSKGVNIPSLPK